MTPWGSWAFFPGGKWIATECLSNPWGKNVLCSQFSWAQLLLYLMGNCIFFIQHLFYHFSPLNHLFFNIADHLIILQVWKNNCLAINDLYPFCLDQQREINSKLVHRGIKTLFRLLGAQTVLLKVIFWYFETFFSVHRAKLPVYLLKEFYPLKQRVQIGAE